VVETSPASDISGGSVILNGNIVSNGGVVDEYGFKYWSTSLGTEILVTVEEADHTGVFNKKISDLAPGTYNYKAYANNTKGLGEGQVYSFTIVTPAIKVVLDGEEMKFEVTPFIEQERTMVPFRAIFEALGAVVQWDAETRTVTAAREDLEIKLVIDGPAYKNGETISLDVPAKIVNSRTFVPLRFVSEALDGTVTWDDINKTVFITR
jgi:hypothetical protein